MSDTPDFLKKKVSKKSLTGAINCEALHSETLSSPEKFADVLARTRALENPSTTSTSSTPLPTTDVTEADLAKLIDMLGTDK